MLKLLDPNSLHAYCTQGLQIYSKCLKHESVTWFCNLSQIDFMQKAGH